MLNIGKQNMQNQINSTEQTEKSAQMTNRCLIWTTRGQKSFTYTVHSNAFAL